MIETDPFGFNEKAAFFLSLKKEGQEPKISAQELAQVEQVAKAEEDANRASFAEQATQQAMAGAQQAQQQAEQANMERDQASMETEQAQAEVADLRNQVQTLVDENTMAVQRHVTLQKAVDEYRQQAMDLLVQNPVEQELQAQQEKDMMQQEQMAQEEAAQQGAQADPLQQGQMDGQAPQGGQPPAQGAAGGAPGAPGAQAAPAKPKPKPKPKQPSGNPAVKVEVAGAKQAALRAVKRIKSV